jgi:hypothetical protein
MHVVITGEGSVTVDDIRDALAELHLTPSKLLSPSETELEKTAEAWANQNNVETDRRTPNWKDVSVARCAIKTNKFGEYNSRAAFNRNEDLATDCDAVLVMHDGSRSSSSIVESAEKLGKHVFNWPIVDGADIPF